MNFYLNAVDEQLRLGDDRESVGIILCADRDETVAKRAAPRLRADRRLDLEGGFTAAGAPSRRDHRRGASGPRRPIRTRHRPNPIDRASRPPHPGVLTAAKRRESIARSRGLSDERASEFGWDRSPINRDGAAREGWDQRGRGGSARHGASYEGSPTSKHPMRTFGDEQVDRRAVRAALLSHRHRHPSGPLSLLDPAETSSIAKNAAWATKRKG
jgi:hypothetical protein